MPSRPKKQEHLSRPGRTSKRSNSNLLKGLLVWVLVAFVLYRFCFSGGGGLFSLGGRSSTPTSTLSSVKVRKSEQYPRAAVAYGDVYSRVEEQAEAGLGSHANTRMRVSKGKSGSEDSFYSFHRYDTAKRYMANREEVKEGGDRLGSGTVKSTKTSSESTTVAAESAAHDYCEEMASKYEKESSEEDPVISKSKSRKGKGKGKAYDKYQAVKELLETYVREHNVNTLFPKKESVWGAHEDGNENENEEEENVPQRRLCESKRSFAVAVYACPTQIGNRLHEFLNAFAGAVVSNRTVLWKYCDRHNCQQSQSLCDPLIQLHSLKSLNSSGFTVDSDSDKGTDLSRGAEPWMAGATKVLDALQKGGCHYPKYQPPSTGTSDESDFEGSIPGQTAPQRSEAGKENLALLNSNGIVPPKREVVPFQHYSTAGEGLTACCGIDTLVEERILDFGILERMEMAGLALRGANLGPKAARRADTLFSGGELLAYGLLKQFAFGMQVSLYV